MNRVFAFFLSFFCAIQLVYSQLDSLKTTPKLNKARLGIVIGAEVSLYTTGVLYLSSVWYRDHKPVPFHFYNDNHGYLQMDKFAHSYIAYHESRAGYELLRWAGVRKAPALIWGGSLGFWFQLPIEIFDGLYEGYGFSKGDVVANGLGSLLFIAQELAWDDQRVKMKYSFFPSQYAAIRPTLLGKNVIEQLYLDYNSHTYWFSANAYSFTHIDFLPKWLCLSIGYSANGMLGEFSNPQFLYGKPAPHFDRYRQLLLSLDVDFSKIKTKHKFTKALFEALNLLKVPFPALEINQYGLKGYWIYY